MSQETIAIKKLLIGLCECFGDTMSPARLALYAEILAPYSAQEVEDAVRKVLLDPEQKRFPLPAAIIERIAPTMSPQDAAQALLARSVEAVEMFGYYAIEQAKAHVGSTVWKALPGDRGWMDFCAAGDERAGGIPIGIARAQLRDRIAATLRNENPSGRVPQLPPPGKVLSLNRQNQTEEQRTKGPERLNITTLLRIPRETL